MVHRGLSPVAEGFVGDDLLGCGPFDKGGDIKDESRRGKLFCAPSDEAEVLDAPVNETQAEEEAISAVECEAP